MDTALHRVYSYSRVSFHEAKIYNDENLHNNTWGKHDESLIDQYDPGDAVIKIRLAAKSSRERNYIQ